MRSLIPAAALAAAFAAAAPSSAQNFTIKREIDRDMSVDFQLQRIVDFESEFSLSVRTDPSLVPSARVFQLIESIGMVDAVGLRIVRSAYDIDTAMGRGSCKASSFQLGDLRADGGTDLFTPLGAIYGWMNNAQFVDHQKAVIIITDGQVNAQRDRKASVEAAKGDVLTLVYFLGASDDVWLKGLADSYLAHCGDLSAQLKRYFGVLSGAWSKQTVLQLKSCPSNGGTHAKP